MGLLEIRARMRSPLAGLTLAQARAAVRAWDAERVLAFTDAEREALHGVIERMQPLLVARAALYARTPWSFIKLDDSAEGGMPHTRGPHIVLPKAVVEGATAMHREMSEAGKLAVTPRGRSLLLHEQTHVLERADPARFEPLFTDVFGFTRMAPAPTSAWLDAHVGTNPDGPDLVWAFALEQVGGNGWIMPVVTFPDVEVPLMPQQFQALGLEVVKTGGDWKMVEQAGVPNSRALERIAGYDAHFPFPRRGLPPDRDRRGGAVALDPAGRARPRQARADAGARRLGADRAGLIRQARVTRPDSPRSGAAPARTSRAAGRPGSGACRR